MECNFFALTQFSCEKTLNIIKALYFLIKYLRFATFIAQQNERAADLLSFINSRSSRALSSFHSIAWRTLSRNALFFRKHKTNTLLAHWIELLSNLLLFIFKIFSFVVSLYIPYVRICSYVDFRRSPFLPICHLTFKYLLCPAFLCCALIAVYRNPRSNLFINLMCVASLRVMWSTFQMLALIQFTTYIHMYIQIILMRKRQFSCSVRFKLRPADGDAALMYWFPQQTTVARSISRMCRISADG